MAKDIEQVPVVVTLDDVVDTKELTITKEDVTLKLTLGEAQAVAFLVTNLRVSKNTGFFNRS